MNNLTELNLTILNDLSFKYKALKLFKQHNLITNKFSIDILKDPLEDIVDFSHHVIESYLTFKDLLKDKNMPNTCNISQGYSEFYDFLSECDINFDIISTFGFEINQSFATIEWDDIEYQETFKKFFSNSLNLDFFDNTMFSRDEYTNISQTILCHKYIDDLFEKGDASKKDKLSNFLNTFPHYAGIASLTTPLEWDEIADIEVCVTPMENLLNNPFGSVDELSNFKYAIVVYVSYDYTCINRLSFKHSIKSFLELYKLLESNS